MSDRLQKVIEVYEEDERKDIQDCRKQPKESI